MKLKCRIKPLSVEGIQYTGNNYKEIQDFVPYHVFHLQDYLLISLGIKNNLVVNTDDFVVKDSSGNLFCCNSKQFEERYEVLDNQCQ